MASGSPPVTQLDHVLLALGHPTRRAMLERLREGPISQSKLAKLSPTALATGVKHVGFLERAALAKITKKVGRTSIRLDTKPLDELRDWMSKLYPDDVQADTVPPMPNADARIRASIDAFIADLSELVRESALDAVRQALQQGGTTKSNGSAARASRTVGVRAIARARKQGAKRTPEELEQVTSALLDYVTKNPGQRIEEIASGMGMSTNDLKLPAKKLTGEKKVKTKGQKRATRYFAR
jgi:DNA-binding transcriptional ArsR family regulator